MVEAVETVSEAQETPGRLLRAARLRKALSIEDVVGQLHLTHACITDIEQDCYDQFRAVSYIRGHLRAYSHFLELDSERILQLFGQLYRVDQKSGLTNPDCLYDSASTPYQATTKPKMRSIKYTIGLMGLFVLGGGVYLVAPKMPEAYLSTHAVTRSLSRLHPAGDVS